MLLLLWLVGRQRQRQRETLPIPPQLLLLLRPWTKTSSLAVAAAAATVAAAPEVAVAVAVAAEAMTRMMVMTLCAWTGTVWTALMRMSQAEARASRCLRRRCLSSAVQLPFPSWPCISVHLAGPQEGRVVRTKPRLFPPSSLFSLMASLCCGGPPVATQLMALILLLLQPVARVQSCLAKYQRLQQALQV